MKILVVSNMYPDEKHVSYGIFVKKFCDFLELKHIDHDISAMNKSDSLIGKLFGYFRFFISTYMRIIKNEYDIIYVHYPSYSYFPVYLAGFFRKMTVYVNLHGTDTIPISKSQRLMNFFTRKSLEKSSEIIVPSEFFKDYVRANYAIPDVPIMVFPSGGINEEIFYQLEGEKIRVLKEQLGLDMDRVTFCYASRIIAGKGWDVFVDAIANLKSQNIDANYVLVGEGKNQEELDGLITKRGLEKEIVRFPLLPQDKLREIYNVADAFVFSSSMMESLGLVAIEALACGTPVICEANAAQSYYIVDGKNGFTYSQKDSKELAKKMKLFIENTKLKDSLSSDVLLSAKPFSIGSISSLFDQIFQLCNKEAI